MVHDRVCDNRPVLIKEVGCLLVLSLYFGLAHSLPPAWSDETYAPATASENRRGPSLVYAKAPFQPQRALALGKVEDDGGAGSGNYAFSLPLVSFPGRGQSLGVSLHYASQLWSNVGNGKMVFDADGDWPSPGWSLGFGKIITSTSFSNSQLVSGLLMGQNKSRQLLIPIANETGETRHMRIPGDSLAQLTICCYNQPASNQGITATLKRGDGTTVTYTNHAPGNAVAVYYPIQITDANGNFTSIRYAVRGGKPAPPMIDTIIDTVGRPIKFYYDAQDRLVTLTAPGTNSIETVYARFIYWKNRAVEVMASSGQLPTAVKCLRFYRTYDHLSGVIFPATRQGVWMPSSTGYGTSSWFSQTTDVNFRDRGLNTEVWVNNYGREASRTVYDYPVLSATDCVEAPPHYSTKTETWRDDIAGSLKTATTRYVRGNLHDDISMTVVNPDATSTRQFVSRKTDRAKGLVEGQLRRIENLEKTGAVLSSTDFEWDIILPLDSSPRQRAIVQNIDPLKRGKRTVFGYDVDFPSLATSSTFYGYEDASTPSAVELVSSTIFVRDPAYIAERLLMLPESITQSSPSSPQKTLTRFEYDKKPLTPVGMTLPQHSPAYEPHLIKVCVAWSPPPRQTCIEWADQPAPLITARGNPTQVTVFADASNQQKPIANLFEYDSTGNVLKAFDDLGAGTQTTYGPETKFSLPSQQVVGAMAPNSPLRLTTTLLHDLGPGLLKSQTDPESRITSYTYALGLAEWRPTSVVSPDGVTIVWAYDDKLLTTMVTQRAGGQVSDVEKVALDGRGQARRVTGDRGGVFHVDTEYDPVGRVSRRSDPYLELAKAIHTTWTYDGLGRIKTAQTPGNPAVTEYVYDGAALAVVPTLPLAGGSVLSTDPWGRQRWQQVDSRGKLRYAVESMATSGQPAPDVLTEYQHDPFGRLKVITSGPQVRKFDHDDLGRLVGQVLPERQVTLNAVGEFSPSAARYTDVFQYDMRSNLVMSIDARGVRTKAIYDDDQLNRLQRIVYEVPTAHDTSSPILPVAPIVFTYKGGSAALRLDNIDSGDAKVVFEYDRWRLKTHTTRYATHLEQPFVYELGYDSFGRASSLTYPARYDATGAQGPRRTIKTLYDEHNAPSQVSIDGTTLVESMVYAPGGRIASLKTNFPGGPMTESFEFDEATGLPSAHKVVDASRVLTYGLTYGFRHAVTKAISGQLTSLRNNVKPALSQDFIYDSGGRLHQSLTGDLAAPSYDTNALWQSYRYDSYGNRTGVEAYRLSAFPCDAPGTPPCNVIPAGASERDGVAALAYDEVTNRVSNPDFEYDASGNLIRATFLRNGAPQSNTFTYDAAGRLAKVGDGAGMIQEEFAYGHDRRRVRTIEYPSRPGRAPRVVYTNWFGGLPLSESTNNLVVGPVQPIWWAKDTFHAGGRVHTETAAGRRSFINDSRGTGAETTAGTNGLSHRATRPFGTEPNVPMGGDDDERFTTYKRSIVTGLDYAVNRFYSPELGRFLQIDPLGSGSFRMGDVQSLNAYSYARNDPINRIDPSGLLDEVADCIRRDKEMGGTGGGCEDIIDVYGFSDADKPPEAFEPEKEFELPSGTEKEMKPCNATASSQNDGSLSGGQWSPFKTLNGPREFTELDRLALAGLVVPAVVAGSAFVGASASIGGVGRFFVDPRTFSQVSRGYWAENGPAMGRSLHHWLLPQRLGLPNAIQNAGFNLVEMEGYVGVFHRSLGLNQWMGFASRWGASSAFRAAAVENAIRVVIPASVGASGYVGYKTGSLICEGKK